MQENISDWYTTMFRCLRCAPGCVKCKGPEPCLATYNWPFRYESPLLYLLIHVFLKFKEFFNNNEITEIQYRNVYFYLQNRSFIVLYFLCVWYYHPSRLHVSTP